MLAHLNGVQGMSNLGENWWDKIVTTAGDVGKVFIGAKYPTTQPQQQQTPQVNVNVPATDWGKIALYGGLAVGGVALALYIIKKRRGRR